MTAPPGKRIMQNLMCDLSASVDDIVAWVETELSVGNAHVEMDAGVLAGLAHLPSATARAPKEPAEPRPAITGGGAAEMLEDIARAVAGCELCPLHASRTNVVPGQGNPSPEILFIGEGPGFDEDRQGLPFVGLSGELLTRMIAAMGLTRQEVFIANVVKCRPPGNRQPTTDEMRACMPYLKRQIAILRPKVIVCLGATAVKGLLEAQTGISRLRGRWTRYESIPVMPTYHPAYLLRYAAAKRDAWDDLKKVLRHLGRSVPARANS